MTFDELLQAGKRLAELAPSLKQKQIESLLAVITELDIKVVRHALEPMFALPIVIGDSVKLSFMPQVKGVVIGKFIDNGRPGLVVKWNNGYVANFAELWVKIDPVAPQKPEKTVSPADILKALKQ